VTKTPEFLPIRELGPLLRSKEVSPVELAKFFLDRLEADGPKYNALVTVTRERALKEARKAEAEISQGQYKGALHGIPYGVKDLIATAGDIPTTWGAVPFKNQILDYDATIVKKLSNSGAVLIGKLAMIELAGGMGYAYPQASATGPAITPWGNKDSWTGGSSSGSGAAVAAGLVPFAIGSETWGSILMPAHNCGISGLRPTYGRVSRYGAMPLSWTLDKLGPMCLTADDCGLVLNEIAGRDPYDHTTSKSSFEYDDQDSSGRKFKFALLKDMVVNGEEAVKVNFGESLKILEQIGTIQEVEFPDLPYEAATRTILNAESASIFEDFFDSGQFHELSGDISKFGAYSRLAVPATDYLRALRIRDRICNVADKLLGNYDAIIGTPRNQVATLISQPIRVSSITGLARDILGSVGNIAGLPSVAVPNGFGDRGLPTGIQFMGNAHGENSILAAARAYQGITDWHNQHPSD